MINESMILTACSFVIMKILQYVTVYKSGI